MEQQEFPQNLGGNGENRNHFASCFYMFSSYSFIVYFELFWYIFWYIIHILYGSIVALKRMLGDAAVKTQNFGHVLSSCALEGTILSPGGLSTTQMKFCKVRSLALNQLWKKREPRRTTLLELAARSFIGSSKHIATHSSEQLVGSLGAILLLSGLALVASLFLSVRPKLTLNLCDTWDRRSCLFCLLVKAANSAGSVTTFQKDKLETVPCKLRIRYY